MDGDRVEVTERTRVRRFPPRGHYDKATIWGILDKALVGHLAFIKDGLPAMLPMMFFRTEEHVYFHGAAKNRMFGALAEQPEACFTATVIDGFVAARAALHHSMNYRSVIIYGAVEEVVEPVAKMAALQGLIERFYPKRWDKIRRPSESEFNRVGVFRLPIAEASAKVRNAFPAPVPDEMGLPVWAGVVPLETRMGVPLLDAHSDPDLSLQQDFSRIAEVLLPSEGANARKAPRVRVRERGQEPAPEPAPEPVAMPEPEPVRTGPAAPAVAGADVGLCFALADGSVRQVTARAGSTVMEAARAAGVPGIVAECGGSMACGTCHVVVDPAWLGRAGPLAPGEEGMLAFVAGGRQAGSRLSCQIIVTSEMDGFRAVVPQEQR